MYEVVDPNPWQSRGRRCEGGGRGGNRCSPHNQQRKEGQPHTSSFGLVFFFLLVSFCSSSLPPSYICITGKSVEIWPEQNGLAIWIGWRVHLLGQLSIFNSSQSKASEKLTTSKVKKSLLAEQILGMEESSAFLVKRLSSGR